MKTRVKRPQVVITLLARKWFIFSPEVGINVSLDAIDLYNSSPRKYPSTCFSKRCASSLLFTYSSGKSFREDKTGEYCRGFQSPIQTKITCPFALNTVVDPNNGKSLDSVEDVPISLLVTIWICSLT